MFRISKKEDIVIIEFFRGIFYPEHIKIIRERLNSIKDSKVVISGRLPNWLVAAITEELLSRGNKVYFYDPKIGGVSTNGEILNISLEYIPR